MGQVPAETHTAPAGSEQSQQSLPGSSVLPSLKPQTAAPGLHHGTELQPGAPVQQFAAPAQHKSVPQQAPGVMAHPAAPGLYTDTLPVAQQAQPQQQHLPDASLTPFAGERLQVFPSCSWL